MNTECNLTDIKDLITTELLYILKGQKILTKFKKLERDMEKRKTRISNIEGKLWLPK